MINLPKRSSMMALLISAFALSACATKNQSTNISSEPSSPPNYGFLNSLERKADAGETVTLAQLQLAYKKANMTLAKSKEVGSVTYYQGTCPSSLVGGPHTCGWIAFQHGALISMLTASKLELSESGFTPSPMTSQSNIASESSPTPTSITSQSNSTGTQNQVTGDLQDQCKALGFKPKTKEFGSCVMQLMEE